MRGAFLSGKTNQRDELPGQIRPSNFPESTMQRLVPVNAPRGKLAQWRSLRHQGRGRAAGSAGIFVSIAHLRFGMRRYRRSNISGLARAPAL